MLGCSLHARVWRFEPRHRQSRTPRQQLEQKIQGKYPEPRALALEWNYSHAEILYRDTHPSRSPVSAGLAGQLTR